MNKVVLEIKRVRDVPLPFYIHKGDSGMDVINAEGDIKLLPFERKLVFTGLKLAVPCGYEVQVRPRSGLALKKGITILNTPGTIDSNYRGELGIILINLSNEEVLIKKGERIAQIVVAPVCVAEVKEVEVLPESTRGEGGFGSTGV